MAEIDPVILELIAKNDRYIASLRNAERVSDRHLGNIERVGGRMSSNVTQSFNTAARAAVAFGAALISVEAARELLRIADSAKTLEAQLRLATRETGSFAQAQEDVRRIAAETRSGLEDTARLYGNIQRNSADLGISQQEAARATETVSKTFLISGASAVEAAQSTRQLVQALQSGVLRGDEFNSVMESSPRLTRLLADSLNIPIGQLRAMAEEGELTSNKLVRAFTDKRFTDGIDAEFRELPVTFDQAMTQVENAAIITFGAFDRGGDFSRMLSTFVADGAQGFAELEQSALDTGIDIRATFEGLANVFDPLLSAAQSVFGQIGSDAQTLGDRIRPLLGEIDYISGALSLARGQSGRTNLLGAFNQGYGAAETSRRNEIAVQGMNDLLRGRDVFFNRIEPVRPVAPARTGGGGGRRRTGGSAASAADRAERERLQRIREEASKAREMAGLDDDILAAKAALATATDDILKFELDQIDRERDAKLAQFETEVQLGNLAREEYNDRKAKIDQIADLERQKLTLRQQEVDAARAAVQQDNAARDRLATLDLEARMARTREERAAIERQILDASYRLEEDALRSAAANGEIANLDEALANLRRRRLLDEQMVARQNMSPGERYLDDLQNEAANLGDAYEDIAVRGLERMNRAFADNVKSALGLHGVLGDIIGDFIELAIRQQILGPLAQNAFGGGSGGGGLFGTILSSLGLLAGGGNGSLSTDGGLTGAILNLPGRASGGSLAAGQIVRVNEGASPGRVEAFRPDVSGQIIPLGRMDAIRGAGGGDSTVTVRLALSGDIDAKIDQRSAGVAVQVFRAGSPQVVEAAVNETIRRGNRGSL